MNRGSNKKSSNRLMTVWVPKALFPYLDAGVRITDSDRSKFVRTAVREKLARCGVELDQEAA